MIHIMKIDEMFSNPQKRIKRQSGFPKDKVYYQVSYEKDGETVSVAREYIHQAKLIYDEYKRRNLDGTTYPNLRIEEIGTDGSIIVIRKDEY